MENVIEKLNGNIIIILFVIIVLSSTVFMGLSERRLSSVSPDNINISKTI